MEEEVAEKERSWRALEERLANEATSTYGLGFEAALEQVQLLCPSADVFGADVGKVVIDGQIVEDWRPVASYFVCDFLVLRISSRDLYLFWCYLNLWASLWKCTFASFVALWTLWIMWNCVYRCTASWSNSIFIGDLCEIFQARRMLQVSWGRYHRWCNPQPRTLWVDDLPSWCREVSLSPHSDLPNPQPRTFWGEVGGSRNPPPNILIWFA